MPFWQYYAASHSKVTAYTEPKTKYFPQPKGHFSHHTCSLKKPQAEFQNRFLTLDKTLKEKVSI